MREVGGILLCGGASRRMGRSKAGVELGGETLLARGVRQLLGVVEAVVVVAGPEQAIPELTGLATGLVELARDPVAHRGPLQGLAVGLAALAGRVDLAFLRGVDGPFLAAGWVECLAGALGDGDLAIPRAGGYHHPLAALYRVEPCLQAAYGLLAQDRLRPVFLLEAVRGVEVVEADLRRVDPDLRTLWNVNTPEELARARALVCEERG